MLKKYFIATLGSFTAIWISLMLIFVLMMVFAVGSIISGLSADKVSSIKKHSVLHLVLDTTIEDDNTTPNIFDILENKPKTLSLSDITTALEIAKTDQRIEGVLISCQGASAGLATRQTIRKSIADFKESGKWVIAYGDDYTQGDYYIASVADEVILNPVGGVELRGLASGIPFFKNLLDKLGIEMQVVKVGTFKSAVEPFILTSMSEANKLQIQTYLDNLWGDMASSISTSRNIDPEEFTTLVNNLQTLNSAEDLKELKIIDKLCYSNELEKYLKEKTNESDKLHKVTISEYLSSDIKVPHSKSESNQIAVYFLSGDITVDGKDGIASERVVPELLEIAEDDDISGLVLRVNSGGGSAFASEQIWHALEVVKDSGKTLYVSMGDYAASGGYYISCGADKIFAEPMSLTGSIGIFGMIPCAKTLVSDKLGINIDYVQTNTNSVGVNTYEPLSPFMREKLQQQVNRGYELFTLRCAEGRNIPQDSIKAIGEGRVWDGQMALKIGLVDELGSLSTAITSLANELQFSSYQIVKYPDREKKFWQLIAQFNDQMRENAIKDNLGEYYNTYQYIRNYSTHDHVQARMMDSIIF